MRFGTLIIISIAMIALVSWHASQQSSEWQFIKGVITYHAPLYERAPLYFPTIKSSHKSSTDLVSKDILALAPTLRTSISARSIKFSDSTNGYILSGLVPPQDAGITSLQYGSQIAGLKWKTDTSLYNAGIAIRDFQNAANQVRALLSNDRFLIIIKEKNAK